MEAIYNIFMIHSNVLIGRGGGEGRQVNLSDFRELIFYGPFFLKTKILI